MSVFITAAVRSLYEGLARPLHSALHVWYTSLNTGWPRWMGTLLHILYVCAAATEYLMLVIYKQKFVSHSADRKSAVLTCPKPVRVWGLLSRCHLGCPVLWK